MLLSEIENDADLLSALKERVEDLNEVLTLAYTKFRVTVTVDCFSSIGIRISQRKGRPDRRIKTHIPQIKVFDIHRHVSLGEDDD